MAFKQREVASHFPLFGSEFPAGPVSVIFLGLGMVVWGGHLSSPLGYERVTAIRSRFFLRKSYRNFKRT